MYTCITYNTYCIKYLNVSTGSIPRKSNAYTKMINRIAKNTTKYSII